MHVFDLLGYGASDKREGQDVSLYAQGKLLARLLEHWKLESPMVVGHDFGGAITLRAHLLEGCDFERIVLMNAVSVAPGALRSTGWCRTARAYSAKSPATCTGR